jgi:hypothetical protein
MKRITKSLVGVTLSLGLIFSGVTVLPENQQDVKATDSNEIYQKNAREIIFYGEKEKGEKALHAIINESQDEALLGVQKGLKKEKVKLKFKTINESQNINLQEKVDTITLPYSVVVSNSKVQEEAKKALNAGIKVYLYDEKGITIKDYKQGLVIEEFVTKNKDENGREYSLYLTDEDADAEGNKKGKIKEGNVGNTNEEKYQLIGYTSDHDQQAQFSLLGYTTGENDKVAEISLNEIISGIISQEVASFNANNGIKKWTEEDEAAKELDKANALLDINKASAASTYVTSDTMVCKYIKPENMMTFGRVCTDFHLFQDFNEISTQYDRFSVKEWSEIWYYNSAYSTKFYTKHDIPYSTDELEGSGPKDTSRNWSISVSYPWSISYTIENADALTVNQTQSLTYDYASWTVTDGWGGRMEDGVDFNPGTAWLSTGSFASMDIDNKAYFSHPWGPTASGGVHLDVNYDYSTANTDTDSYYP